VHRKSRHMRLPSPVPRPRVRQSPLPTSSLSPPTPSRPEVKLHLPDPPSRHGPVVGPPRAPVARRPWVRIIAESSRLPAPHAESLPSSAVPPPSGIFAESRSRQSPSFGAGLIRRRSRAPRGQIRIGADVGPREGESLVGRRSSDAGGGGRGEGFDGYRRSRGSPANA
jgi:hypothetical protein